MGQDVSLSPHAKKSQNTLDGRALGAADQRGRSPMALARALRPKNLKPRGAAIWREMTETEPDAVRAVVITELCRMADQLDQIDALLSGDAGTWATVALPKSDTDGEIVLQLRVDALVVERRQTVNSMRQLATQLKLGASGGGSGGNADAGVSFLDQLVSSAADRIAEASTQ